MQRLHRNRELALPELFEAHGQLLHRGPGSEYVVIGELPLGVDLEILVADVAAADEGDRTVGNEQLVVHAEIEPRVAEEVLETTHEAVVAAVSPGIEDADLDVRRPGEAKELLIAVDRLDIVDEDAHAYAAGGSPAERLGDELPRLITVEDVVLQIERAVGGTDELEPQQQAVDADRVQPESGLSAMGALGGEERLHELRVRRLGGHGRWLARIVAAGQRRAGAQQGRAAEGDQSRHPCQMYVLVQL